MRLKLILLFIFIGQFIHAQEALHLEIPKTNWQSFGFQKQVEQVAIAYYKSDSLGYEPAMLEVYTFNKVGHLLQKYIRIFGKYESETGHNYVYNEGVLDSINTVVSAQNFNSKQKLHYNQEAQLDSITASGAYTNFTDHFIYDDKDKISSIERRYKNGGKKEAIFDQENNYVHEKETDLKGNITNYYYIYQEDELFASINLLGQSEVIFYNAFHRNDFKTEITDSALKEVLRWRALKNKNLEKFEQQISELMDQATSKIVLSIPAESINEEGDWIKRLQIDNRFFSSERRLVFKSILYVDGTTSGSSDYDLIFEKRVSQMK